MCQNNLRQIMLGILNYESANRRFPTDKIVTTADGQQLRHSWRVLILPYLEENNLYQQYDFNEPWNGPNNIQLESKISDFWCCPSQKDQTKTTYKLVNGPGTAFEFGSKFGLGDIPDGCGSTIGLIEDAAHPVSWLEPGDFTAEEAAEILNSIEKKKCAHVHNHTFGATFIGSQLVLLDASTWHWPYQPDTPITVGAFLIDDGIEFDGMVEGPRVEEVKYHAYIAVGIYLFLIGLPVFRLSRRPG